MTGKSTETPPCHVTCPKPHRWDKVELWLKSTSCTRDPGAFSCHKQTLSLLLMKWMSEVLNESYACSLQGLEWTQTIVTRQFNNKTSIQVWYLNWLPELPGRRQKLPKGITGEKLTEIDRRTLLCQLWLHQSTAERMWGSHPPCSGLPGQMASCQTAINLFFNLTFSLASPLGLLHKQGNQEKPSCDYITGRNLENEVEKTTAVIGAKES